MATYRFNTKLIKKFVDAQKERIAGIIVFVILMCVIGNNDDGFN